MPAGTTNYSYSNGYPNDGFYTVSNGTFGNGFDWHEIPDHTSVDTNGKFLIVNAAAAAGEFYKTKIDNLCGTTTYEFSAWLMNLVIANTFCSEVSGGAIPINVRFEIWDSTDTILIKAGNTDNIVETTNPNWQEFGLVFQTLAGQNGVILKMINNGQGGCGNDLAIDDIEFKTCGDLTTILDSANNTNISICELQTPYTTTLTAVPDNSVFSSHFYQWQESTDGNTWTDIVNETNQDIFVSGIIDTRYYRSKVSESTTTLNDPLCNTLSDVYQVTVNPSITPSFTQVPPICSGDTLTVLPTTSNNGIEGSWSPAIDNMATTIYTFTPIVGECAVIQTMTITVNPFITPTFIQVPPICSGDTLTALPTTSNNGIEGSWSPAINNMATTIYTFTPIVGECAVTQTMTIMVNPVITPTFIQVPPICSGDILTALPTTSNNGITGSWSPAINNTTTTTYSFMPSAGECAVTQSMTITVNPVITPTFIQVPPICSGDTLTALPTTSNNGITGSWSPAINNTATTTYSFIPSIGECAVTQTMTITVNANQSAVFNQVSPICNGDTLTALPTISNNGVTGTWRPALNNMITTTYTFAPDLGFCPMPVNLTIEVFDNPNISLQNEYYLCFDINEALISPVAIDTGLNTSMYNFTWLLNGIVLSGADQAIYMPMVGGNYEVIVQNITTTCSYSDSTIVTVVNEPDFEVDVITNAFLDYQIIQVNTMSSGDFEFKLDEGLWQDEPSFNNVSIGPHVITVRDKRGCVESNRTVVVMGYPKYFTPNGDGQNDTWNIIAPTSPINYLASAKIYIFDRYGKLLKQINPTGNGWAGIYNGANMPNDDYWFIVDYIEPNSNERREFKAHFTLKR